MQNRKSKCPFENTGQQKLALIYRESSQVWPDYRILSFFYFQLEKQQKPKNKANKFKT